MPRAFLKSAPYRRNWRYGIVAAAAFALASSLFAARPAPRTAELNPQQSRAYNMMMTIMERLVRKGTVIRTMVGGEYRYEPNPNQGSPAQASPNQTNPNQAGPSQAKPNQTNPAQPNPSPTAKDQFCQTCHGIKELAVMHGGEAVSLYVDPKEYAGSVHANGGCSGCHTDITAFPHPPKYTAVECGQCHKGQEKQYDRGVHGKAAARGDPQGPRCGDCHGTHGILPVNNPKSAVSPLNVNCAACHQASAREFKVSVHGTLLAKNDPDAPSCVACHNAHEVLSKTDPHSPTFPTSVPAQCGQCHSQGAKADVRYKGTEHNIVARYMDSIHGQQLNREGLMVTATCTSCHTTHRILPASDPKSSVNPRNVTATCGACHAVPRQQFERSAHSALVTKTTKELPVCNDCHTAHSIRRVDEASFRLAIMPTCGRCHQDYTQTYFDNFHGQAARLGSLKTAMCYDCHGSHDILPVADPLSRLSPANVVQTCKQCHPGATPAFTAYLSHGNRRDRTKYPYLYWTFWAVTSLLITSFVVNGIHMLLLFPRSVQIRRELHRIEREEPEESEPPISPQNKGDDDA